MSKIPHKSHKCFTWELSAILLVLPTQIHRRKRKNLRVTWRCTSQRKKKPTKYILEMLGSEREGFPFRACTLLIQHSRLSAENTHFRLHLPHCSSPCFETGDVTDAFGQQCCSAGWGRGKAGLPGFTVQLLLMKYFLFVFLSFFFFFFFPCPFLPRSFGGIKRVRAGCGEGKGEKPRAGNGGKKEENGSAPGVSMGRGP